MTMSEITNKQVDEMLNLLESVSQRKGRGAERLEILGEIIKLLIDSGVIKTLEVDWKEISDELCPILKIEFFEK